MKTPSFLAYLPSKKFVFGVLIGLLFMGSGFLIFQRINRTSLPIPEAILKIGKNNQIIIEEVTKNNNGDGLKEYETINKTNQQKEPEGAIEAKEIGSKARPAPTTSLTEIISQQFFNDYLAIKEQKNGGALSETEISNLLSSFFGKIESSNILETVSLIKDFYTETDIKVAANNDPALIKEYGNNLAVIIKKHFDLIPESEIAIFSKAMQSKNPAEFEKIKPLSSAYRNSSKDILDLTVPPNFAEKHLKLINHFNNIATEIDDLAKFFNDPVVGFNALSNYKKDGESALEILRSINGYFSENQVVFKTDEAGEYFKHYQ